MDNKLIVTLPIPKSTQPLPVITNDEVTPLTLTEFYPPSSIFLITPYIVVIPDAPYAHAYLLSLPRNPSFSPLTRFL